MIGVRHNVVVNENNDGSTIIKKRFNFIDISKLFV